MTPILELTGTYSRRSRSKCTYLCSRLARIVRCRAAVSKIDVHSDEMDPDGCTGKSNKDEHDQKKLMYSGGNAGKDFYVLGEEIGVRELASIALAPLIMLSFASIHVH